MQLFRPAFAQHPLRFGRGPVRAFQDPVGTSTDRWGDLKLFAATFVAGFLFVSILIG
ncbi:MAG TPA: hypothetical protein VJ846_08045 [Sphingomicrobium sp.]|nr:hypothetical protein [Sphingomicrobium sp.]